MTKVRQAGSAAEAIWNAVAAIGRAKLGDKASVEAARAEGVTEVSTALGLDIGTVRNILNPDRPEQLSLERSGLISRTFDIDELAQWLAQEAGGLFVPLPSPTGDIEKLTAEGVRQVGETAAQVIEAIGDGSEAGRDLSLEEAQQLRKDARLVASIFMKICGIADETIAKLETRKVRK